MRAGSLGGIMNQFSVNAPKTLIKYSWHHRGSRLPEKEVSKLMCRLKTQITLSCLNPEL